MKEVQTRVAGVREKGVKQGKMPRKGRHDAETHQVSGQEPHLEVTPHLWFPLLKVYPVMGVGENWEQLLSVCRFPFRLMKIVVVIERCGCMEGH